MLRECSATYGCKSLAMSRNFMFDTHPGLFSNHIAGISLLLFEHKCVLQLSWVLADTVVRHGLWRIYQM